MGKISRQELITFKSTKIRDNSLIMHGINASSELQKKSNENRKKSLKIKIKKNNKSRKRTKKKSHRKSS
tara:strand:- start:150 stop:356 length:207 start_codon:yes stop_codon:yes gene_type:complete